MALPESIKGRRFCTGGTCWFLKQKAVMTYREIENAPGCVGQTRRRQMSAGWQTDIIIRNGMVETRYEV